MNSKEAYQKSNEYGYNSIQDMILGTCSRGGTNIILPFILTEEIVEKLKLDNYSIVEEDNNTYIYWGRIIPSTSNIPYSEYEKSRVLDINQVTSLIEEASCNGELHIEIDVLLMPKVLEELHTQEFTIVENNGKTLISWN